MSTAAPGPAAPAPKAPQSTGQPTGQSGPQPGPGGGPNRGDGAGTPTVPSRGPVARPIPPGSSPSRTPPAKPAIQRPTTQKSPLPGVRDSEPGEGHENETVLQRSRRLEREAKAPKPATPAAQVQDGAQDGTSAGDTVVEGSGGQITETKPTDGSAPKFKFGGREYATQEAAENAFKSAEGRASAAEMRVKKAQEHNNKLLEINRQWEQRHNELLAGKNNQPQLPNQPVVNPQPQPTDATGADLDPSDAKLWANQVEMKNPKFWSHAKTVFESHGPDVGMAYVMSHYDNHVQAQVKTAIDGLMQQLAPILHPIYQERVSQVQTQQSQSLWADFSTYVNDGEGGDGSPLFPELVNNPQAQKEVAHFWLTLGNHFGKEFAMSQYGIHRAYQDWAAWKQSKKTAVTSAAEAATQVIANLEQERAQGALMNPTNLAPSVPSPDPGQVPTNQDDARTLRRAIAQAPVGGRGRTTSTGINLGFRD